MADTFQMYETDSGRIFRISLQAFPGFFVNAYAILTGSNFILIDTGSGFGRSNDDLLAGFTRVSEAVGRKLGINDLTHILLTHAHIDHFGGLPLLHEGSQAYIGIHELDHRIIANYEETFALTTKRLAYYFIEAGVPGERIDQLLDLYRINKSLYRSVECDFTYESDPMMLGPFEFLHVPGHTAGHVMLRFDNVIFTGDHILEDISPHQAPEQLTLSTGLMHYLTSLEVARTWYETADLILPGHKGPLQKTNHQINQIKRLHRNRLEKVVGICEEISTIDEISQKLFKDVSGYNVILALEETGAHVEFLHQCGLVKIANFHEIEDSEYPIPILYQSLPQTNLDVIRVLAVGKLLEGR